MNIFTITLVINFCAVHRIAAGDATSELGWKALPLIGPLENYEEMQRYIDNSDSENSVSFDSYILAYNHERDRTARHEKSRERRTRRSAPELIKFELEDAKEPDAVTKEFIRRIRERKILEMETLKMKQPKVTERSDEVTAKVDDQAASASHTIHVYQGPGKRINSPLQKMPAVVRKAIESVLQKKSLYKVTPSKRYASSLDVYKLPYSDKSVSPVAPFYGELPYKLDSSLYKAVNLDFANQIPYIPALFSTYSPDLHDPKLLVQPVPEAQPLQVPAHNEQIQSENVAPELTYIPHILPAVDQQIEPIAQKGEETASAPNPKAFNGVNSKHPNDENNIRISLDHLGNYEKDIIKEFNLFRKGSVKPRYYGPLRRPVMTQALTELISKTPTEQLQGLSQLLATDQELHQHSYNNRAPIVFPPVMTSPAPPLQKDQGGQVGTEAAKQFTPITEHQDDVTPAPILHFVTISPSKNSVVHITPKPLDYVPTPPTSYKEIQMGLSPNYDELEQKQPHNDGDDDDEKKYGSRYAFGYRIRDFHTGNNFGHSENRDDDGITRGQYHTLLPDGRVQNVQYHVDDSGYHADVTYQSAH